MFGFQWKKNKQHIIIRIKIGDFICLNFEKS